MILVGSILKRKQNYNLANVHIQLSSNLCSLFSFGLPFNRLFGFYKGILPPILAETPKRAVKVSHSVSSKMHADIHTSTIDLCCEMYAAEQSSVQDQLPEGGGQDKDLCFITRVPHGLSEGEGDAGFGKSHL